MKVRSEVSILKRGFASVEEIFYPESIGFKTGDAVCFVCGSTNHGTGKKFLTIRAFTKRIFTAKSIIEMLPNDKVVTTNHDNGQIEIKISGCPDHELNVKTLFKITKKYVFSKNLIQQALKSTP